MSDARHTPAWTIGYHDDWGIDGPGSYDFFMILDEDDPFPVAIVPGSFGGHDAENKAHFILRIPGLLAEVEALTAQRDALAGVLRRMKTEAEKYADDEDQTHYLWCVMIWFRANINAALATLEDENEQG